ncbi:hypothetical protein EDD11_010227 [Mortierella claussenii]|nr:hypothetical protein EDD11_010227 [Mortierella claussenii]
MLWPIPSPSSLPKAAAAAPAATADLSHDDDTDVLSSNSDHGVLPHHHQSPFSNTFDNSRPSSPAPATPPPPFPSSAPAGLLHPALNPSARVLSSKISLDTLTPPQAESLSASSIATPLAPLRTPPESPVKNYRRDSFRRQSCPPLPRQSIVTLSNRAASLSSPPSSPTQPLSGATLPPKLSQSLLEHPLFRGCTPEGIHQLASRMHIRHYHPQDHIIRRSEQSSAMFYVLRGAVKVASHDNEATYYEIKENNFFGDVGVLYRVPRSMDVLAKNRCTIAILSGDDLVKAMEQSPEMAKAIGYQTQERYQMYLKRRQSISAKRTLDGGTGGPDQCQEDSRSDSFVKGDIHSAIRKVPLFQSCSTEVIHMLSLKVEPRTYNLGESIIRRGEIGRELFFIVSGVVEVLSDDNLRVLARFHDGQFFGEIAVLLDVPRIANVKAVSQVEVFVLTKDNLKAVFQAVPGAAETITAESHRLYKNWLIHNNLQSKAGQALDEDEGLKYIGLELNHESLNVPWGLKMQPGFQQGLPSYESDIGAVATQSTDQQGSYSAEVIHPIEAGHPAAISVLPMTFTNDFSLGHRGATSPTATSSVTESAAGPLDGSFVAMQEPQPDSTRASFFDQEGSTTSIAGATPEPPMSRNPTIRGLQESTPKRRRASVAVWSQQDLLKLAETAGAKVSVDTTHAPSIASAMAANSISAAQDSTSDVPISPGARPSPERRSSSGVSLMRSVALKKLTGPATFGDLDESIVAHILNSLPLDKLLKARRVCKSWNKLILEHDAVLREIDLSRYKKIATDAVLMDLCSTILKQNTTRTTRVSLRDCFLVSDKGLTLLAAHMPAVEDLDLHSCWNITDAGFRSLGVYCPQLRSVDFSNCRKLGDETIYGLYPKEAMAAVDPDAPNATQMTDAVLGPQAELHPDLEDTVSQHSSTTDTSMDEAQVLLTRRSSIESGPTEESQATSREIEPTSPLSMDMDSASTKLPVAPQPVTTSGPRGCPLLARLNLSYCKNLTDKSFIHLSLYGSKQLEYLNLQRCTTITSEAFVSLDPENKDAVHQHCLNDRNGQAIPIHDGYNPLVEPCFPRLRELHLSDCTFLTDDAIVALAPNMPRLEVLSLSFCCALTDVALEALCENCLFLQKLDLSFCGSAVSDASLYLMARFDGLEPGKHSLKELEIRGCVRVTERGVKEVVGGCVNLRRLNVSSCSGIGSGDFQQQQQQQQQEQQQEQQVHDNQAVQEDVPMPSAKEEQGGQTGTWASLSNTCHSSELTRKMSALKRGKEWALAQQRPGLDIIV